MQAILWPIIVWILREIVLKFVVFTTIFAVVAFFVPYVVAYLSGFTSASALTTAFAAIPAGVWYFLDLFRIDYGAPLVISAFVYRFLIRRMPVIG